VSETGVGAPTAGSGGLYDEAGNRIGSRQNEENLDSLIRFAREQPLATALGALILGYILGKLF